MDLLDRPPRNLFFTGKGGVGKTSVACATALALAERGRRVLLVSTDPASNLGEVLETPLGPEPRPIAGVPGLFGLDIDPEAAARAYRERVVGPYRGVLPEPAVRSIEEQLSGACTVEIAAFDEFSKLLGDARATAEFDHVVFDTAPTGHTLRLLELPAAWAGFLESNAGGTSCLGPLAGLAAHAKKHRTTIMSADQAGVLTDVNPIWRNLGTPPASDEQKRAARDPLSSIVAMGMTIARTKKCDGAFATFDGRFLYTLTFSGGKQAPYKTEGYDGRVIKCVVHYNPVAGYEPKNKKESKKKIPKAEMWFALTDNPDFAPPVRMILPLGLGNANLTLVSWRRAVIDVDGDPTSSDIRMSR